MTNLNEKFKNVCFAIYCEAKHLELYIDLLKELEIKGNSNSELIKIIKNSFGLQIACIFSRLSESSNRDSANIFYVKNMVGSEIRKLSENENEVKILRQLISSINNFQKKYERDIEAFKNIKDVKISHNDLKFAKLGQVKNLQFDLTQMTTIAKDLIKIFKTFIPPDKDKFSLEFASKVKGEICLLLH